MLDFNKLLEDNRSKTPEEREAERARRDLEYFATVRAHEDRRNCHIFRLNDDPRLNDWERDFVAQMVLRAQRDIQNRDKTIWVSSEFTDRMEDKIREMAERYPETVVETKANEVRYAGKEQCPADSTASLANVERDHPE
jgi:chromatin segregation and condensation protein Rec8/ScpA/Scc1 (kleisin family)